ncbi:threonine/serine dehydratase [Superficieibacter sp.]|uniref:threonine/serine dehydratase n=1 Tax=Superficieibacter sp. TaxID=2303322 RepID=UPI0028A769A3|nr:threonine/serine dehydratase [Superficieibacter sp.]
MSVTRQLTAILTDCYDAHQAIRPQVAVTPLLFSPGFSKQLNSEVWFKAEHLQHTGSFKFRGASNKLRLLDEDCRARGVITASSGNHGQGMALAGQLNDVPVTVYASESASSLKLSAIRAWGAKVITLDTDPLSVEIAAAAAARQEGKIFVSPYNDKDVIAGQGTIALEMLEQQPELDAVFVAVGGGGLISGIGAVLKNLSPHTKVIGCWPEASPAMYASLQAQHIVEVEESETLSDGTAGGLEPGSITFPLCMQVIDECVLVSEAEIRQAMREIARSERWMIEGAAGVAVAALLKQASVWKGKRVAVVLCGRNIMLEKFIGAVS